MKQKQRARVPQSCGQMLIPPPSLRDVQRELRASRFECIFESWHGQNLYSLHVRLSDGAQVLVVAAGHIGLQPVDFGSLSAEVFTVEAITPSFLAAKLRGDADCFAAAGAEQAGKRG